jgi:hypothetical protein
VRIRAEGLAVGKRKEVRAFRESNLSLCPPEKQTRRLENKAWSKPRARSPCVLMAMVRT